MDNEYKDLIVDDFEMATKVQEQCKKEDVNDGKRVD